MSQLEITFEDKSDSDGPTIAQLAFGKIFKLKAGGRGTYMRVKTVNFLNNSNLLSDVFSRGDCVVVLLERGTVSIMKGDKKVIPLEGNMKVRKA